MLWDTAHPLQPLAWNGRDAVVGEGSPWALASSGTGQWLAPDWQGTVGDVPRDPWGAPETPGLAGDAGALGYRGEIEFDGEIWLRNRAYQPATRAFHQPDPLGPVPGTALAANPYHYAANNPLGLSDPLGLRPVGDQELQAIRDRMDKGFIEKHAGDISAITGIAAVVLSFTPLAPLAPFLAGASAITGSMSAYQSYKKGDMVGAALDVAGVALAPVSAIKAFKIARAGSAMQSSTTGAREALHLARGAESVNLPGLAASRYRDADKLLTAARGSSIHRRTLRNEAQNLAYGSMPVALVGMGRSHAIDHGLYTDPYMPNPVPSFGPR